MQNQKMMRILDFLAYENGAYIKKLGELLDQEEKKLEEKKSEVTKVEELECKEGEHKTNQFENLSIIFSIFKNLFFVADQNTIELLLSDDNYMITFGALECN
jgi:hypothetical protein